MTWWASGNARQPQGPQAREAGRADRRLLGTTRAGVGPAPSQNIIRAQIIIISGGTVTGLFEYSGAPAAGNPPVAYSAAPGTTKDPFGNALPFTSGGFVTVSGAAFAALSAAGVVFHQSGNTADPQITGLSNAGLNLNSGQTATLVNEASFALVSAAVGAVPSAEFGAALIVKDAGATPAAVSGSGVVFFDSSGFLRFIPDSATSDSTIYNAGEAVYVTSAAQTINSTTPATITGLSQTVGAKQYYFKGLIRAKQGATNVTQLIGLNGPTVSSTTWFQWNSQQAGANTVTFVQGMLTTVSLAFIAGDEIYWRFEGTATFSAAGTFACVAAEGTAGDTFTIQPGSFFIVRPMS